MNQAEKFDVVIIGGGPAGSTAALRLLALGYKIALVESELFPRNQIGESLSPGVWNIFRYLNAEHLLDKVEYIKGLSSCVIWETKTQQLSNESRSSDPRIMVDRSKLDFDLLSLSVERGLRLFQPAKFESCHKINSLWKIIIRESNISTLLSANYILDARGRRGVITSNRLLTAPPTLAIWTNVNSNTMPHQTNIEAMEQAWVWGSPTANNQYRIMAFIDPQELKKSKAETFFINLLSQACLFEDSLKKNGLSNIHTYSVLNYTHLNPWGNNYIHIGEAAFSLDPLSSTGVEKAMRFSLQAVIALNTLLKLGDESISKSFYEAKMIESIATHTVWTSNYYAKVTAWSEHDFWKYRSQIIIKPDEKQDSLVTKLSKKITEINNYHENNTFYNSDLQKIVFNLWEKKMYVSQEVTYVKTICVIEDTLRLKIAIKHPSLNQEIAFLEEYEIIKLLKIVETSETFGDIIYHWNKIMTYEQAIKIAGYLIDLKILC